MLPPLVLATGRGIMPAVRVWTANTGRFSSRPIQNPDPLPLGVSNLDQDPSTCGLGQVWLDPSVPISGSAFRVSLFVIAFRYATGNRTILTLVHSCMFIMYWPPWWSKRIETHALPHPQNDCQRSVDDFWSCVLGNETANRLQTAINQFLAAFIGKTDCDTLPAPYWKWVSTERQGLLVA